MKHFDIKSPERWHPLSTGEVIKIEAPNGPRKMRLSFNTTSKVAIHVGTDENMKGRALLAASDGMFDVSADVAGEAYIAVSIDPGGEAWMASHTAPMVVSTTKDEVFTTVEPMNRRNGEYDRMLQFMKMNEARRDAQLNEERKKLRQEREEMREERRAEREAREAEKDDKPKKKGKENDDTAASEDVSTPAE